MPPQIGPIPELNSIFKQNKYLDFLFCRPNSISQNIETLFRGPTPEWVGWTVTGPSPAEGYLPWPGVLLVGELAQVPHDPER